MKSVGKQSQEPQWRNKIASEKQLHFCCCCHASAIY